MAAGEGKTERRGNWKDQRRLRGRAEKMAEGERPGKVEKGREQRAADGMRDAGTSERGSQHWGLLIKVGLVDPLMKVQTRGLLSALLS